MTRKTKTRIGLAALVILALIWALCPKPNPGKPVPADTEPVDLPLGQAQD